MSSNSSLQPPCYQQAQYLKSALENKDLPPDQGIEVAFIGRSNAGKSSALNTITGIKGLARTSNTPGRTQMINFFTLDEDRLLVDLPGYGYAKVPASIKERWQKHVNHYLTDRSCLAGLVVIADVRHPLKAMDEQVITWAVNRHLPVHVLLTKRDKLNNHQATLSLQNTRNHLKQLLGEREFSLQLFSAVDRSGLDEIKSVLNQWFCPED
jgi:GTP-binding protein